MISANSFKLVVAATLVSSPSLHALDECKDVLAFGVFNTERINSTVNFKRDYEDWLCTTEFRSHDEAANAGISIGVPVYDIPLQIGASFSNNDRDTWKRTHCQNTVDKQQYASRYSALMSHVAPEVLEAWRNCMEQTAYFRNGIKVSSSRPDGKTVNVSIRWLPNDPTDVARPVVTGFSLAGGKVLNDGFNPLKVGAQLPPTSTTLSIERTNAKGPVTMVLNTTRGDAIAFAPPIRPIFEISGSIQPHGEKRRTYAQAFDGYARTPGEDCTRDTPFSHSYSLPNEWTLISNSGLQNYRIRKDPDRSFANQPVRNGNTVVVTGHAKGNDSALGYCANPGEVWYTVTLNGEKWVPTEFSAHPFSLGGSSATVATIEYPNFAADIQDTRDVHVDYNITVRIKVGEMGDEVRLNEKVPEASGIKSSMVAGRLTLDMTKAAADWQTVLER